MVRNGDRSGLRVLDHAWHQAHSYRLHELPARFDYFPVGTRYWDEEIRPAPDNFGGFIAEPVVKDYDLILSHLDNWCDRAELRATPFRIMNLLGLQAPEVPRVCIMHGTPDNEENRGAINRLLDRSPGGAPFMVCNSHAAFEQWGRGPELSRAIIHGYNVDEFVGSNERQAWAITVCSAGDISAVYHGVPLLERIKTQVPVVWVGHNGDLPYFQGYEKYLDFLAHSLIYVHTGQRSPMPGARTEAMLSGCCIVTTSNQDAGDFITHGETGFLCDTAEEMTHTIRSLLDNPRRAYTVGKAGRELAREIFDRGRYVDDWLSLISELQSSQL